MHVRLERSDGILERIPEAELPHISETVILGPFEWVQLTYQFLRVSPEGEHILACENGDWMLCVGDERAMRQVGQHFSKQDGEHPFSDVVVY